MYQTFFAALFLASHALADTPVVQPAANANAPVVQPAANANTDGLPPSYHQNCTTGYLAFSERDIAIMSYEEQPSAQRVNESEFVNSLAKLNTTKALAYCQDASAPPKVLNSLCDVDSCNNATVPVCTGCKTYTLGDDEKSGTMGTDIINNVKCYGNYAFNSSAVIPNLCGTADLTYACDRCTSFISCNTCYDATPDNSTASANPPATNPPATNLPGANPPATNPPVTNPPGPINPAPATPLGPVS